MVFTGKMSLPGRWHLKANASSFPSGPFAMLKRIHPSTNRNLGAQQPFKNTNARPLRSQRLLTRALPPQNTIACAAGTYSMDWSTYRTAHRPSMDPTVNTSALEEMPMQRVCSTGDASSWKRHKRHKETHATKDSRTHTHAHTQPHTHKRRGAQAHAATNGHTRSPTHPHIQLSQHPWRTKHASSTHATARRLTRMGRVGLFRSKMDSFRSPFWVLGFFVSAMPHTITGKRQSMAYTRSPICT
jgi:hypothetical protein